MNVKTKIGLAIAAVAAVGALAAGLAPWSHHDGAGGTQTNHNQNTTSVSASAGACVIAGNQGTVNCPAPAVLSTGVPDSSIASSIARSASPGSTGPWAFNVLYDEVGGKALGLFIRSSPDASGFHLGLAAHLSPVWVDCMKTTSFDPDPGTNNGPRCYKVHWPRATQSDEPASSSPSDPAQGWAYSYYLRPNGTNGHVPTCS